MVHHAVQELSTVQDDALIEAYSVCRASPTSEPRSSAQQLHVDDLDETRQQRHPSQQHQSWHIAHVCLRLVAIHLLEGQQQASGVGHGHGLQVEQPILQLAR